MAATHVNHMQKALDQMNVQLQHVISDITGLTGLAIIDAILAGQRDPLTLAKLRHERIKASEEVIAKSLVGDYRAEHLVTLRQSLTAYRSYQKLIDDCDKEIRRCLDQFKPPAEPRSELKRVFGVDLTKIPGIRTGNCPRFVRRNRTRLHEVPKCIGVRFVDGTVSRQRYQRRQGSMDWHAVGEMPDRNCIAHGRAIAAPQQDRARQVLPPYARQTRRPKSDHGRST
jgi:hypothetical protein